MQKAAEVTMSAASTSTLTALRSGTKRPVKGRARTGASSDKDGGKAQKKRKQGKTEAEKKMKWVKGILVRDPSLGSVGKLDLLIPMPLEMTKGEQGHPAMFLLRAILSPVVIWALEGVTNARRTSDRQMQAVLTKNRHTQDVKEMVGQYDRIETWLDKYDPPVVTDLKERLEVHEQQILRQFESLALSLSETVKGLKMELNQTRNQAAALASALKCLCTENSRMHLRDGTVATTKTGLLTIKRNEQMSNGEGSGTERSGEKGDGSAKGRASTKGDGKAEGQARDGSMKGKEAKSDGVCKGEARKALEEGEQELKDKKYGSKDRDKEMKPPPARTSSDTSPSQGRKRKERGEKIRPMKEGQGCKIQCQFLREVDGRIEMEMVKGAAWQNSRG
jgi:hypothetical protein